MNNIRNIIVVVFLVFSQSPLGHESTAITEPQSWVDVHASAIMKDAKDLNEDVLKLALADYKAALDKAVTTSPILSVVDFSKVSGEKRLWVIDLNQDKVLFHELVAHGLNSGDNSTATKFSNVRGSYKSSLGLYRTGELFYAGKLGVSLRLHGLNPGINDNVYDRGVIVHGAGYVTEEMAKTRGHVGKSLGCFSVRRPIAKELINKIKDGSLIYAYHPQITKLA